MTNQDKKTAVIVKAIEYIMDNPAVNHWIPFMTDNNLGIPYAIGIELGHIENLTDEGWNSIDETYVNLCEALGTERLTRSILDDIFLNEEDEEEEEDTDLED
jgi:hypothetical protein